MLQVTDKGIVLERLDEIHARIAEAFKKIYGQDVNIDPDSPDGQMIGIFSQGIADINEVIGFLSRMMDPYQASGEWLEQRVLYAGLVRRAAEYSYIHDAAVIGSKGAVIPKGSVFADENQVKWESVAEVTLDKNGSARIELRSVELGAFALGKTKELELETVVVGVNKITLLHDAEIGTEEETDGQLLTRFMRSHSINNQDDKIGLEAYLRSLTEVRQAVVLENYTAVHDAVQALPPHSLSAIVLGGKDDIIALAILKKKIGGCGVVGSTMVEVEYKDQYRKVYFERPKEIPIKVKMTLKRLQGFVDINTTEIKTNLSQVDFSIGQDVYAMHLVCEVNKTTGFVINSITVNGLAEAVIGLREYAKIYPENVEVLIE